MRKSLVPAKGSGFFAVGSGDSGIDQHLSFFNQSAEMRVADKAFSVNLVDVFSARRTRREPAVFGHDLQATNSLLIAGGMAEDLGNGFSGQGRRLDLFRGQLAQQRLCAGVALASTRVENG